MKNPLRKRLPRQLKQEFGKYIVIFLLLALTISFISGFLVADGSMIRAYNESFEKYNIEDGHFSTRTQLNPAQRKSVQQLGITLYDMFYVEQSLDSGSTLRVYSQREQLNLVCLMEGELPAAADEIAIDRMYADNNEIGVGDVLTAGGSSWTVTGLVALSDYSALFYSNSDTMFDADEFGVAVVTPDGFAQMSDRAQHYCYSWLYDTTLADEEQERDMADDLLKELTALVPLTDYVPRCDNQAIQFTGEDMGSDRGMMIMLLYILIAIIAFVFAITTGNTIASEAAVIGTLRASGCTKGELVRHYMSLPMIVTLAAAIVGNILGYTVFKNVCAAMYYGSYSLPTYVTVWNAEAFLLTTVVPLIIMLAVNWLLLRSKLSLSPMKFLRRDLSRRRNRRAFPLSRHLPFFFRFRLRVIFQNLSSYATLLVGILFANLLLMFGLGLPSCLNNYQAEITDNMLCDYQYVLTMPYDLMNDENALKSTVSMLMFEQEIQTENEDAEKFTAYTLQTDGSICPAEDILLYGVAENSRYVDIGTDPDAVYVSQAYSEKYLVQPGDTITLCEEYEDDSYTLTVTGVYSYNGALAVFLPQKALNEMLDYDEEYFSGYFSNSEITDIDEQYIGSVIDYSALTRVSRQLDKSMGDMMYMVDAFAVIIYLVLMYLLTKMIIEKNGQSISMSKILGYSNGEIANLYLLSTTIVTIVLLVGSIPLMYKILAVLFRIMILQEMTGWIALNLGNSVYVVMLILGICSYAVVALLEYRRIRRVPMDIALKNVE